MSSGMRTGAVRFLRRVGSRARRWWYSADFRAIGAAPSFGHGLLVIGGHNIRIGDHFSCWRHCTLVACDDGALQIGHHVSLNANVYLNACGGAITIGNDVMIGPNVVFRASDHRFDDSAIPIRQQGHVSGTITIEDNVWLAANVVVLAGVRIGSGAVVAAGAVVTSDVPPASVVGGVPARVLKMRSGGLT